MDTTDTTPGPGPRSRVHAAAHAVWEGPIGNWLRERGEELATAAADPSAARIWIRATAAAPAGMAALALLAAVLHIYGALLHAVATGANSTPFGHHLGDLVAATTHPVHHYLAGHAAALPVTAALLYALWQVLGVVLWLTAWRRRSNGARLGWVLLGAGTGAMVWAGSPAAGQALAIGTYVLLWALISIPALRGLRLRLANIHVDARPQTAR
jgi:hypothetical protein